MSDAVQSGGDQSSGVNVTEHILKLETVFEGLKMDVAIGACGLYAGAQLRDCSEVVFRALSDMFFEHMVQGAETVRKLVAEAEKVKSSE